MFAPVDMHFVQDPPQLGNVYRTDPALQSLLRRELPAALLAECEPELDRLGALAGDELYRLQLADRLSEPRLTQWDPWGNRRDRVELTASWRRAEQVALEYGLVASAYERDHGAHARSVQFAKVYLFSASTDFYSCPLAMTDGAARALLASDNAELIRRAVPRLTSRDPALFWTSGQWMTEATGGSDVGLTRTQARCGADGRWRLYGRKWFTSAIASQMALTLARPEENPAGGSGLALFYLETRDAAGQLNGLRINRLKDKLGTRKVPTAELELDGAIAVPVQGLNDGIRRIAPMLNITRTWNAIVAVSLMRRGLALARDYATRRDAFGAALIAKPLHADTLAGLEAECQAGLHLSFFVAGLIGRAESETASDQQLRLLRLVTPIAKALTGRQAVAVLSEVVEAFGGAGYVEDTGIAMLLRDAQVLPIWEGTTNVLALDVLRTLSGGGMPLLRREIELILQPVNATSLLRITAIIEHTLDGVAEALASNPSALEADARRILMTLGRTLAAALLARHAQWARTQPEGAVAEAAVRRFTAAGLSTLAGFDGADTRLLVDGVGPSK
jgi:alkylation response protein AidB-like acyl-CoA dehydrogenase